MASTTTNIEQQETGSERKAVEQIKDFLNQILRITTKDGRVFIGTFAGTDQPLNLILINAEEYRISGPDAKADGRFVGQVTFPWKIVVKVEGRSKRDAGSQQDDNGWYFWYKNSFLSRLYNSDFKIMQSDQIL
jgi:small nuclear ribonucleoprotein (snRNP)-like protein